MTEAAETVDLYAPWRAMLAGEKVGIVEDDPLPGRYKIQFVKGGPIIPVAIDPDGLGGMVAMTPFCDSEDMAKVWPFAAKNPISPEDFEALWNAAGSNNPPADDSPEALIAEIEATLGLKDAAEEARLADALHLLKGMVDEAETARKAQEEPHKAALAEIKAGFDERYAPAADARKSALPKIAAFLQRSGKDGIKGRFGKKISLRKREEVKVTDPGAFADWLIEHHRPAVVELLAKSLKAKGAAGVPGVEIVEKVSAQ